MRLYYQPDGKLDRVFWEAELFANPLPPLTHLDIDEVDPENKALCVDLKYHHQRRDEDGQEKYFIENEQLVENIGWEEWEEPLEEL